MTRDLGRVIAEKRLPIGYAVVLGPFSLLLLFLSLIALRASPGTSFGLGLMGGVLLLLVLFTATARFEIRERGATARSMFHRSEVAFEQLRTFGYAQMLINRVQPQVTMTFVPYNGKPVRIVVQPSGGRAGVDHDLEALRTQLTSRVAARMRHELMRRGRVEWLPRVAITRDGFVVSDGRQERHVLFGEVTPQFAGGGFELRTKQDNQLVFSSECGAPNFYPGLSVVEGLAAV